jgi:hypothetical protein
MFDFGLSYKDFTRIVWTFVEGVLGYAAAVWVNVVPGDPFNWKGFAVGALAAGWSAIKNFTLADGSPIK